MISPALAAETPFRSETIPSAADFPCEWGGGRDTRISVELDDDDFVNVLVAILRQEGHRVVEPEVAEVRVMKCQSPREAIVLRYTSPVCDDRPLQIVAFLKSPVSVRQLASAVRRMVAA